MDGAAFGSLFAEYEVVPVWRDLIGDGLSPISAYQSLAALGDRFLLESVETGRSWGRFSFVGVDSAAVIRRERGRLTLDGTILAGMAGDGVESALKAITAGLRAPRIAGMPPLYAGVVGVLGAESMAPFPGGADAQGDPLAAEDVIMMIPRTVIAFDHLRQTARVIQNVFTRTHERPHEAFTAAHAALDRVIESLGRGRPLPLVRVPSFDRRLTVKTDLDDASYHALVDKALGHVLSGEVDQLTVSRRYWADAEVSPVDVYRMLRIMNPSPYMYLFDVRGTAVVGSSPQSLVGLRDGRVNASAIGGSRPRGADAALDAAYARELAADEKELTEHAQLVAQARRDFAPLVRPGSTQVDAAPSVQLFSHVMHLVTTMRGEIAPGASPVDVLASSMPAGTVCGSPRAAARRIGAALEPTPRGLYGGAVGYLDFCGNLDTCIGIRTLFAREGRLWSQAGATVVSGSSVDSEVRESSMKVTAVFAAVAAALGLDVKSAA